MQATIQTPNINRECPSYTALWRALWAADASELPRLPNDQLDILLTVMEKTIEAVAEEIGARVERGDMTESEVA